MLNNNKKIDSNFVQIGQDHPSFFYIQNISMGDLLEAHANATPHKVAVRFGNQSLNYAELNVQVNHLANYLKKNGLQKGQKIAIYLTPSLEQILSILAIFKMGCCYIPLDINYPKDRLLFIIKDCSVDCLLTGSTLTDTFSNIGIPYIIIDERLNVIKKQTAIFKTQNEPYDLAYIIYTSGSTGVPNGVKIHSKAVNNHMLWMKDYFHFTKEDKILLKTPLSFDPSIWELLLPFYVGCELVIAPQGANMDPNLLIDTILDQSITTIQLVPSFLKELLRVQRLKNCHSLQRVFCGGESLTSIIKKQYFEELHCPLFNLYGPTEATINITSHQVTNSDHDIKTDIIGKPIYHTTLYVVNSQGSLAEINQEGELYIGSESLSTGYHNRDVLTQERFITNPFEPQKYAKIYKTGDWVRWLSNGDLEYLGRNNDQIKINGVRIEPNEIVSVILEQATILDSVVIKKTDSHGYDYLACYFVLKEASKPCDIELIKSILRTKFPRYMLPKTYVKLNNFPLTLNGKVDKSALPEPHFESDLSIIVHVEDMTETEHKLLLIWQMILNIPINIGDNFFEIGGTSLLALKLLSEIQSTWKIKFSVREVFTYATIKTQANFIQLRCKLSPKANDLNVAIPNPIVMLQAEGTDTPLFLIHPIGGTLFWYFWLSKLLKKNRPLYGILDPSIELEKPVFESITEIARFYLQHIKKIQPNGKYIIGGASFGATLALEIAYLLEKEGREVLSVVSLDGWGVYPDNLYSDSYFRKSMERQHEDLKKAYGNLKLEQNESLFQIQWHRLALLKHYQVKSVKCPMVLFKSEEILPIFQEINASLNHWDKFFESAKLNYYLVPGNHETMFQKPHVEVLASQMDNYFEMLNK